MYWRWLDALDVDAGIDGCSLNVIDNEEEEDLRDEQFLPSIVSDVGVRPEAVTMMPHGAVEMFLHHQARSPFFKKSGSLMSLR